ncbi:MAG: chorismate lyase [Gammaproteobacteria bacterium]|nr:chorismate lyase [Gammaproteobacteria bacterium]
MRYKQEPNWREGRSLFKNSAPKELRNWLIDRNSLTRLLTCACNKQQGVFSVKIFHEAWEKPQLSESRLLRMQNNELGFVRQVHLYCGDTPWVYARTVIPRLTLHGELQKLTKLGTQPLGAVLFANRHISREAIEVAKLTNKHTMFDAATINSASSTKEIWGRRSVFKISTKPLLVSEIFLPELPSF